MKHPKEHKKKITIVVPNELGLHARAAANFVKAAERFESRITVSVPGATVSGKSIMGLLTLQASRGARLTLEAEGADAETAVATLAALIEKGFGETETAAEEDAELWRVIGVCDDR